MCAAVRPWPSMMPSPGRGRRRPGAGRCEAGRAPGYLVPRCPSVPPATAPRRSSSMRAVNPRDHTPLGEESPDWYRDAVIYELHVRSFFDSDEDGIGDFRGLIAEARLPARPRRHGDLAAAVLPLAAARRRLRHRRLPVGEPRRTARCDDFDALPPRRPTSAACGSSPSWCSTTPPTSTPGSSARAARRPAAAERDFYVWSDTPDRYRDARIIFKDFETSNWSWDPVARPVLLAPLLLAPARPQLREPRGPARRCSQVVDFWFRMGVDGLRLDAVPYLYEREGTNCENLPETHAFLKRAARPRRRDVPRPHAARRGEPVARGRRRLLRRRRRVPHGLPLPADAAALHGRSSMEDRFPIIDILQQTPEHPRELPVGDLPAQPRRAHARDGDRRGARLHVPRLRARAARPASTSASAAASRRCSATTGARSS